MNYTIIDESCKNIYNKRPCSIRLRNCLHYVKGSELNLKKPETNFLQANLTNIIKQKNGFSAKN